MLDLNELLSKIGITKLLLRLARPASGRFSIFTSQYFRLLAHTVYLTPLILGFAAAYLFAAVPQMQEVYLGIVEDADYGRGIAGLAAVSLFSALLYAWNHVEVSSRIDTIYPDHADIHLDRRILDVRDFKTAFAASLPFFGLLLGLAQVYRHVLDAEVGLPRGALRALSQLPGAIIAAAAITLLVYLALLVLFYRFRKGTRRQKQLLYLFYGLTVVLVAVPIITPDTTLIASRLAGPLASTAFVMIELAVAVRLLFWFLRRIFSFVMALPSWFLLVTDRLPLGLRQAALVMLPLVVVAAISTGIILGENDIDEPRLEATPAKAGGDIGPAFHAWLAERKSGSSRYPVFVVAAQGGGIYAASTAGAFLAMMQDHCPAFARHVFAISAVSGGSVGASLFNAAFADSIARGTNRKAPVDVEPGCDSLFARPGELSRRLRAITQDDHISPVLAYLVPDFLRGIVLATRRRESGEPDRMSPCEGRSAWGSRDRILENSFIDSFKRTNPSIKSADGDCPEQKERNLLAQPFSDGWSQKGDVPALLLNATWVETGYRVAFAPFSLQSFGAGTLYSFDNLSGRPSDPSLIKAAVISARFPGLMPPWDFQLDKGSRLTFVDGGYADSSGAATALQLYKKLKELGGEDVDLYLITLTDKSKSLTSAAGVQPVGSTPVRGWLYDFFSPVNTLLSVRDLQSRKAVTEARTELSEKMIVVQLDQKAFPLPLGWKLSGLSSDVIRLTIGDPGRCTAADDGGDTAVSIANRNNCELKRIVDVISPKTVTSLSLFANPAVPGPKPDVASAKPDIAGPKSIVASPKLDVAGPKSVSASPKPDVGGPKLIIAPLNPEVASPKPAAVTPKTLGAWAPSSQ